MLHGGACLARTDAGVALLVDAAIPGELVEVEVTGRRAGVTRGRTVAVLEASPDRVEPPCPYVPECGGCDLQHVAYLRQLQLKLEILRDAMRRQAVIIPDRVGLHGMEDPWRYRWRGEFHVVRPGAAPAAAPGAAPPGLGFNRARSRRPIAVDDCLIHHRAITTALPRLRGLANEATVRLDALHLTAGEDGDELVVQPRPQRAVDAAAVDAAAIGVPAGEARWVTAGTTLRWRGHRLRVTPASFIQVNWAQMDVLYQCALDCLGDIRGARVVDAYAGVGTLSVELGVRVGRRGEVVCIEENRAAAALGVLNARINGVEARMRHLPCRVEDALAGVIGAVGVDAVVLDPPRAGCAGGVTGLLAMRGPERVVYVSCDPATLARDLHVLAVSGPYRVERVDLVDMFPQTHHIETVAGLVRTGAEGGGEGGTTA